MEPDELPTVHDPACLLSQYRSIVMFLGYTHSDLYAIDSEMLILNDNIIACEIATLAGHYLTKSDPNIVTGKGRKQRLRA